MSNFGSAASIPYKDPRLVSDFLMTLLEILTSPLGFGNARSRSSALPGNLASETLLTVIG